MTRQRRGLRDVPAGVSYYRYAFVNTELRAFTSDKVMKYVMALDGHKVEPTSRMRACQKLGSAKVARVELDPIDLPTAVRIYGAPMNAFVGGVGINGQQYMTLTQLSKISGVKLNTLRRRARLPHGSVRIKDVIVPVTSETILWAHGEQPGSQVLPDII